MFIRPVVHSVVCLLLGTMAAIQQDRPSAEQGLHAPDHARQYKRLLIRNAMIIYGNARPPYGPMDILLQDGVIADIRQAGERIVDADAVIDATGQYVMPGIVNTHMHWHEERAVGMVTRERAVRFRQTTAEK